MMDSRHQIFLSYARADLEKVRPVYETLSKEGFEVYWDQTHLNIGDKWQEKIPDAISDSQLFLACLSTYSVKHDGYSQKEIRRALEISERKPLGSAFILPLLLDECAATMPKKLRDECTYVRFFEADGPVKLIQGIKEQLAPTKNAIAPVSSSSDIVGGLNALLCGDEEPPTYLKDFIQNLATLVEAVSALQRNSDSWANERYISFISGLINSVIDANIVRFRNSSLGGDWPLLFPRVAAEMADDILAEVMKAMDEGDHYDVISDLASWRGGHLSRFEDQTKKAVNSGVVVRRVFNLLRPSHGILTLREVKEILKAHLNASRDWQGVRMGKYQVKILDDHVIAKPNSSLVALGTGKIVESHFGVFRHGQQAVRFRVPSPDLTEMILCRDQEIIERDLDLFKKVWEASDWLDETRIERLDQLH